MDYVKNVQQLIIIVVIVKLQIILQHVLNADIHFILQQVELVLMSVTLLVKHVEAQKRHNVTHVNHNLCIFKNLTYVEISAQSVTI